MRKKLLPTLLLGLLLVGCGESGVYDLKSDNGALQLTMSEVEGVLSYELKNNGEVIVQNSEISILPGKSVAVTGTERSASDTTWKPTWGQFSEVRDNHKELRLKLDIEGVEATLYARLFDEGVGFRYEIEDYDKSDEVQFYCEYNLLPSAKIYYTAGENPPVGPLSIEDVSKSEPTRRNPHKVPIVVEYREDLFLSMIEGDLLMANGFNVMTCEFSKEKGLIYGLNTLSGNIPSTLVSPWRVILVGQTAGDLVTNTVALNLASPCQIEDTSWVKPGKTLWDWRVHGYTAADGFVYGINTATCKRFIDFAAENDIEYFMMDSGWYTKATDGVFTIRKDIDIEQIMAYADKKGVGIVIYYDRKKGEYGDEGLYDRFGEWGMKGVKYGFMGVNTDFSREAIAESAKRELMIDFHDGPAAMTGAERTLPNAVTREYCHAQQDSRKAFDPETFIGMALVNGVQGVMDMNNGNFAIENINSGARNVGPLETHTYFTTVAAEAARTLIIYTGLLCIPDAPEEYAKKADLFDFIKRLPIGRWDESIILNSKINELITTARRHGDEWFIGSNIDSRGGSATINFDFLKEGVTYDAVLYEDGADADSRTNPESYVVRKAEFKKGDVFEARMAPGGGHCMWLKPRG